MDMAALQQAVVEQAVVSAARAMEDQLDSELQRLEKLDEDDIERLRTRRIAALKKAAARRAEWLARGHGEYREILGEKEFFAEMKGVERMVCHFYRENWPCKVMDKHLQILAAKHVETKFVKMHAEKSPFLVERLKIFMLPTLAIVKKEKTTDYIVGFDELGGKDDFTTEQLATRLGAAGAINLEQSENYGPSGQRAQQHQRSVRQSTISKGDDDEDSDFSD